MNGRQASRGQTNVTLSHPEVLYFISHRKIAAAPDPLDLRGTPVTRSKILSTTYRTLNLQRGNGLRDVLDFRINTLHGLVGRVSALHYIAACVEHCLNICGAHWSVVNNKCFRIFINFK